jgi:rare lipoprotein A (peptidoglycan hydrolase)
MMSLAQDSWQRFRGSFGALAVTALCLSACAAPSPEIASPLPLASPTAPVAQEALPSSSFAQTGLASWYRPTRKLKRTANGEKLRKNDLTAAHRTLPMDTMVRVTNLDNGSSVVVRVNDRGPFVRGRVIDVSAGAASLLGMKDTGVAHVRIEVRDDDQRPDTAKTAAAYRTADTRQIE